MAEIRKSKSTEISSRQATERSPEPELRHQNIRHSDDRRSVSPNTAASSRRSAEASSKDKKSSSSSKHKSRKENTLSPSSSSKSKEKDREKEREKEKSSSRRQPLKLPDSRFISAFENDVSEIDTSEDIDLDDIDAEFKFDAEEDDAEENVFTTVPNPFLSYFESGTFSDCTLVFPDGSQQKAHRLILAYCSRWFYNELLRLDAQQPIKPSESDEQFSVTGTSKTSISTRDPVSRNSSGRELNQLILSSGDSDAEDDVDTSSNHSSVPPSPRGMLESSLTLPVTSTSSSSSSTTSRLIQNVTITLPFADENNSFSSVLKWMYTGQIALSPQNCVVLSVIAERYQIPLLQRHCRAYISANLQRENALDILLEAVRFKTDKVISRSISIVARNFPHLKSEKFRALSFDIFLRVLQHRKLAVPNGEFPLYKVVSDYALAHKELAESQIYALMSNVRFRLMSFEDLEEVSKNTLVPRGLLVEAAMYRLMSFECSQDEYDRKTRDLPVYLQPRPKLSLVFDFNKESTELFHGIIGWISTKDGTEDWRNPHIAGRVKVHSSSLAKGSRQILVDKTPNQVWTSDVPSSWFSIDFGPHRRITPTFYSLRHGGNYKGDTLRTWDLQGSVDGIYWKTIKRHQNDKALTGPFSVASWPVDAGKDSFRFFRILQTSHNSSGHNFLVLSGLEFFGRLDTA